MSPSNPPPRPVSRTGAPEGRPAERQGTAPVGATVSPAGAVATPRPGPRPPAARAAGAPRRARLSLTRIDPWSAMKLSFMFSIALAITAIVAVTLLWLLFSFSGVFDSVSRTIDDVLGSSVDVKSYFGFGRVVTITVVLAVLQIVLFTALATLFATLYNVATGFVGGLDVVLSEDD